jgi:hypothetical protein
MGTYHPNPQAVVDGLIGRPLQDLGETYESYTAQLREGEQLWLVTYNSVRDLVILIDDPGEFNRVTRNREGKGPYVFHALPRT